MYTQCFVVQLNVSSMPVNYRTESLGVYMTVVDIGGGQ